MSFGEKRSTISQILTIRQILEDVRAKKKQLFVDTSKALTPYTERKRNKYNSPTAYPKKPSQP